VTGWHVEIGPGVFVDIDALTPAELDAYAAAHPDEGVAWACLLGGWAAMAATYPTRDFTSMARLGHELITHLTAHPEDAWPIAARLCEALRRQQEQRGG
jgi:hypothetical protein